MRGQTIFCGKFFYVFGLVLLALGYAPLAGANDASVASEIRDSSPAWVLQQRYRLVGLAGGKTWVLPVEARLRQQLDLLPRLKERLSANTTYLNRRIRQNRSWWTQRQQIEEALKADKSKKSKDPKRKKFKERLDKLKKISFAPGQLAGVPDVKACLVDLTNSRQQMWLSIQSIRGAIAKLEPEYAQLRADGGQELTKALQAIHGARLGPVRRYDGAELHKLREYEAFVLRDALPVYRLGPALRVGGVLNEQTPATFTLTQHNQPVILTTNMVEAAGIRIPPETPRKLFRISGRRFKARRITLSYLRFGNCLLRDVPAVILPPEGEDMGGQINPTAFRDHQVLIEPENLRLRLVEKEVPPDVKPGAVAATSAQPRYTRTP